MSVVITIEDEIVVPTIEVADTTSTVEVAVSGGTLVPSITVNSVGAQGPAGATGATGAQGPQGIPGESSEAAGAQGAVQFAGESKAFDSDEESFFYDKANKKLGINTDTPEGVLHVKPSNTTCPEPGGIMTAQIANLGAGAYGNNGYTHEYRCYYSKVIEGETIYSTTYLSASFTDDGAGDTTYNVALSFSETLPAGVSRRVLVQDTYNSYVYNYYLNNPLLDNNSSTLGNVNNSGASIWKAIFEDVNFQLKASASVLFGFDKVNKRVGIGTNSPSQRLHVIGDTYAVPNPTGAFLDVSSTTGYDDTYENIGTTHTYRAYAYKIVDGIAIYSTGYIDGSFTDDGEGGNYYSVYVSPSISYSGIADGIRIFKVGNSGYYDTDADFIDGDSSAPFVTGALNSTTLPHTALIEDAYFEIKKAGVSKLLFDTELGGFRYLKICNRISSSQTLLELDGISGQAANLIQAKINGGTNIFSVSASGLMTTSSLTVSGASIFSGSATFSSTSQFNNTATFSGLVNAALNIRMTGSSSNRLFFGTAGVAVPNSNSLGQKIQLYGTLGTVSTSDYAIGVESAFLWFSSGGGYKFYSSTGVNIAGVNSAGALQSRVGLIQLDTATNIFTLTGGAGNMLLSVVGSSGTSQFGSGRVALGSTHRITWHSNTDGSGAGDVGISRNTAGVLEINNNTAGAYRDLIVRTLTSSTGGSILSDGGFRLTAFGAYIGVLSGPRFTFNNGSNGIIALGTNAAENILSIDMAVSQTGLPLRIRNNSGIVQLSIAANGRDFILDTATGTKWGTATNQKQSFWNATPIVQPTTAVAASTFVMNTSGILNDTATFDGYTVGQIVKALRNIGLLA